jgi:hypothetical protein
MKPNGMHAGQVTAALIAALACAGPAQAQGSVSRGELLYTNHCGGCHTQQMHWRDKRVATDWGRLLSLVAQWQEREKLGWTPQDITEVARHLNDTIYKHPRPAPQGKSPWGDSSARSVALLQRR